MAKAGRSGCVRRYRRMPRLTLRRAVRSGRLMRSGTVTIVYVECVRLGRRLLAECWRTAWLGRLRSRGQLAPWSPSSDAADDRCGHAFPPSRGTNRLELAVLGNGRYRPSRYCGTRSVDNCAWSDHGGWCPPKRPPEAWRGLRFARGTFRGTSSSDGLLHGAAMGDAAVGGCA